MCEGEGNVLLHAHFLRNTDDLSEIAKEDLIYMLRNFTSLAEAEDEEDDNTGGTKEEEMKVVSVVRKWTRGRRGGRCV